jgi:hypothetical protein
VQYYKSYYLKKYNKVGIDFLEQMKFGLKVFTSPKLEMKIAEVMNDKQEISFVIYYTRINSDKLQDYHRENYDTNMLMGICEELFSGVKISFYRNNMIVKYSLETYYEDGKPKLRQEFNKDFELVEYCQSIYNADGVLTHEKYFYADSWTIHTEKMII